MCYYTARENRPDQQTFCCQICGYEAHADFNAATNTEGWEIPRMILHIGERVYWGAPEVIYLEGMITSVDEKAQSVIVHIDRATPHSSHLIGSDLSFSADGVAPLRGESPPGVTSERRAERLPPRVMSDDEKLRSAAAVAVHQQYGYTLPEEQEHVLIEQVAQVLNSDPAMRKQIIASMDEILKRAL